MLQVSGRESRIKHKALLVGTTPPTDTLPKPDFDYDPQMLPGAAFDRMCTDPEVVRARKRLIAGASTVLAIIAVAATMQLTGFWHQVSGLLKPAPEPIAIEVEQTASSQPKSARPMASPALPAQAAGAESSIKRLSFRSLSQQALPTIASEPQQALEMFLAAASVDEKLALVANPEAVEPRMRAYYQTHPVSAVTYEQIEPVLKSNDRYTEFRVTLKDGSKHFAAVLTTPTGPKVDWPSFVALGDLEWDQLRESRPTKPVLMRVSALSASHFVGSFSDEAGLRCVQLLPAGNAAASPIYGYVPKATDLDRDLDYWLRSAGGELAALTVKVCYASETADRDQVWITELVVPGWVTTAERKDG